MHEKDKTTQPDQSVKSDAVSSSTADQIPAGASDAAEAPAKGDEQVDPRLLELLVCPLTKTRLQYDSKKRELVSKAAGLAFPIKDGVPLMIVEAARQLED